MSVCLGKLDGKTLEFHGEAQWKSVGFRGEARGKPLGFRGEARGKLVRNGGSRLKRIEFSLKIKGKLSPPLALL